MSSTESAADTGLEVLDLATDPGFRARTLHVHSSSAQTEGMLRIARAFVENPDTILQELVDVAVELCGADSAGISIEQAGQSDECYYQWVATAGQYKSFLNATLPRYPSACGVCIDRGQPQLLRVGQRFFDLMGVEAPTVTDGILLPWQTDEIRGTIWIMAHSREEAFDRSDVQMMQLFANFAAMGVRQQRQQKMLLLQAGTAAANALAHELAHKINNPLQSLMNLAYMASVDEAGMDAKTLANEMGDNIRRLSQLVQKLLAVPVYEKPPR